MSHKYCIDRLKDGRYVLGGPEKGRFCRPCLIDLGGLLGEKDSLNVGKNSSLGNSDSAEKFVQLLIVFNSQLEMSGNNS